jgi:hypothetical protein
MSKHDSPEWQKKREYFSQYYQKHREEIKKRVAEYKAKHRIEVHERSHRRFWNLKLKALEKVSGGDIKCRRCGTRDIRVLTINHKDGGGSQERAKFGWRTRGTWFYKLIVDGLRDTSDLEVLCQNCNIIHEYEIGRRWQPRDYKVEELNLKNRGGE